MVSSNTTVDFIDLPYRHVAVSPHQQKLRLVERLANGGRLDFYLIGRLDNHEDSAGYAAVKEVFHYHAAHEDDYRGLESVAAVLLLKPAEDQGEYRGWFRFLLESHHLFDVCVVASALDISWDRYKAIVVPDARYLSDALAARLDAFVQAGGTLVASGRSGFYDQDYEKREAPALKSLGIRAVDAIRGDMRGAYFQFGAAERKGFPALCRDGARLPGRGVRVRELRRQGCALPEAAASAALWAAGALLSAEPGGGPARLRGESLRQGQGGLLPLDSRGALPQAGVSEHVGPRGGRAGQACWGWSRWEESCLRWCR